MKPKIRLEAIEHVKRVFAALPPHHDDEVSKKQAIRMLIPDIEALRAKGYGLAAIAQLLSDNNVAITAGSLKTLVGSCPDGDRGKKRARSRRQRGEGARQERGKSEVKADGKLSASETTPPRPSGTRTAAAVRPQAGQPARASEAAPSSGSGYRGTFIPRPDSDEI